MKFTNRMIRAIIFSIFSLFAVYSYAQQFEFGAHLGYSFSNIVNSKSDQDRAVIGNSLRNSNHGFNVLYYFRDLSMRESLRLNAFYRVSKKGSVSELIPNHKYEFSSKTLGLTLGLANDVGHGFILSLDIGLGQSFLDNENIYIGDFPEFIAFNSIQGDLVIKNSEWVFLFAFGLEKEVLKTFKLFLEFNGDPAITRLNTSNGSFRTQGLGFSLGGRYVLSTKRPKQ